MNWKNSVDFKNEVMNNWETKFEDSGCSSWEDFYEDHYEKIIEDTINFVKSYSFFNDFDANKFIGAYTLEDYNDILNNLYDFADDNEIWMGL